MWIHELSVIYEPSLGDYRLESRNHGLKEYDFQFGISMGLII